MKKKNVCVGVLFAAIVFSIFADYPFFKAICIIFTPFVAGFVAIFATILPIYIAAFVYWCFCEGFVKAWKEFGPHKLVMEVFRKETV